MWEYNQSYLAHHGTPGMHWGHRKEVNNLANKKTNDWIKKNASRANDHVNENDIYKEFKTVRKQNKQDARSEVNSKSVERGQKYVNDLLSSASFAVGTHLLGSVLISSGKVEAGALLAKFGKLSAAGYAIGSTMKYVNDTSGSKK